MSDTAFKFDNSRDVVNYFWAGVLDSNPRTPLKGAILEEGHVDDDVMIVGLTPNHKGLVLVPANGNPDDSFTILRSDIYGQEYLIWGGIESQQSIPLDTLQVAEDETYLDLASEVLNRVNEEWDRQQKAENARKENMRAVALTFETGLKVLLGESASFQVASKLNPDSAHFQEDNLRITEPAIDRLIESLEQMKNHVKSFPYGQ